MHVEFLEKFSKDLDKISARQIKQSIEKLIVQIESASTISVIPHIKKLSGFKSAYRIRIGDYRIGVFIENNVVQFARIVHRKDIYKVFP